ncbi:hypothetical protein GOC91_21105 [Sinorhizobium medicae]|uniref:Transmembrane protein n=2 Tax=Sinorhizobium medicae TaxID=110321 RepID=A0A508WSK5_9HYPH|nr:membrane protein [Sinorhizobium medicae]ABR59662.1 conserved hypothetical protein [Sinorhizobium medicae WSM419]MBO1939714.1 hypothetical protein [Sinorhizobium medicae]MDX0407457.1 hypothetical protein [Sinorhizobium medicae]MDX0414733.1 hypothetical protein [Sinorhizobium medicae]MDX0419387.1 hypothetical protein [Sinorhizobium medicae]
MIHTRKVRLMLASVALFSLAGPAMALDGADMMKKLNAATTPNGSSVSYDTAEADGDVVTVTGMKLQVAAEPGKSIDIGDVTFEGVEETEGGGYYAETVSFPDIAVSEKDASFSVKDIAIGGLSIPGKASGTTIEDILLYETAGTGPMTVSVKGKDVFTAERTETNLTRQEDNAGLDFDARLAGIKADLSGIEDAKAKDAVEQLGLTTLDGEVTMKGSWELESGNLALDEYALDFTNVGRLNIAMDFSGYTPQFMRSLQEAAKAAEANPNKEEANQAMGLAMLGLMQQLTFNSASIRFDDASITKKALDYAGSQQGVTGEQLAQSLKGLVPIMMAQLNVPELQNQVTSAVNAFLDEPKSLTISAKPEKPVPFPMIMGAAMGAPNTIPSVLGVKVTAND